LRSVAAELSVNPAPNPRRSVTTPWGSCTPKNNLNFSWRLLKAPVTIIDYVIVHELAHLLEPNHTPHFWSIVAVQVPRSEWARAWLREHGELLEVGILRMAA
jgi:predicted metal-dependent hydrolase